VVGGLSELRDKLLHNFIEKAEGTLVDKEGRSIKNLKGNLGEGCKLSKKVPKGEKKKGFIRN